MRKFLISFSILILFFHTIPISFARRIRTGSYHNTTTKLIDEEFLLSELENFLNEFQLEDNFSEIFFYNILSYKVYDENFFTALSQFLNDIFWKGLVAQAHYLPFEDPDVRIFGKGVVFFPHPLYTKVIEPNLVNPSLSPDEKVAKAKMDLRKALIERLKDNIVIQKVFKIKEIERLSLEVLLVLDYIANPQPTIREGGVTRVEPFMADEDRIVALKVLKKVLRELKEQGGLYASLSKKGFYKKFLEEAEKLGLKKGFESPGEKFQIEIKGKKKQETLKSISEFLPCTDTSSSKKGNLRNFFHRLLQEENSVRKNAVDILWEAMKERQLVDERPRSDDKAIKIIMKKIDDIPEAEIDSLLKSFIIKLSNSTAINNNEAKLNLLVQLSEILASEHTLTLRNIISQADNLITLMSSLKDYWGKVKETFNSKIKEEKINPKTKNKLLTKFNRNSKVEEMVLYISRKEFHRLSFILTDRRPIDLFRGHVGHDCEMDLHFYDTMPYLVDPAVLLFRIEEEGQWIGHMICVVAKEAKSGEAVLIVDTIQISLTHPLSAKKNDKMRKEFSKKLVSELEKFAEAYGFRRVIFVSIGDDLETLSSNQDRGLFISNRSDLGNSIWDEVYSKGGIFVLISPPRIRMEFKKLTAFKIGEDNDDYLREYGFQDIRQIRKPLSEDWEVYEIKEFWEYIQAFFGIYLF